MNELLDTEAEEILDAQFQHKVRAKDDTSSDSEDETIIDVHLVCKVENSEDLMKICGDAGVWQIMTFCLGALCGFNCAIQNFIYLFAADTPDYWCDYPVDVDPDAYSNETLKNMFIPKNPQTGQFEECSRYQSTIQDGIITQVNKSHYESCNTEDVPVQYDQKHFAETIGTEWSLVCQNAFWLSSVEGAYMVGVLVGSVVFGMLSDKYGRKRTIWIATFMFVMVSPLVALSTNFVTLLLSRFLLGTVSPGVYSTTYVLVIEAIGYQRRGLAGSLYSIPYSIGYMVLPIIAYFMREWRNLQLTCASLSTIMVLTWWYLPESPRWLILKGHANEAETLLRQIASINGRENELPKNFSELVAKVAYVEKDAKLQKACQQRCRDCSSATFMLLHTRKLRFRVLCISIAFVAISLVYYGIAINPINLGFDKYLFTFLCGLFEIPATIVLPGLIEKMGRRIVFSGFFLMCGGFLLLSLLLPEGSVENIILCIIAQLFISANSSLIYLYSSELFPTELRGYSLGICSMIGRTGAIASPYIVELVGETHKTYPTIIFGSTALIAGVLTFLLPETKNLKLPETVAEVEAS